MSSFPIARLRVKIALLCLFFVFAGVCVPLISPAYAAEQDVAQKTTDTASSPVVFIGFTGVRWEDINEKDTPNLFAFTQKAAGANLVVKTFGETTCPTRGWFTLGSGVRMDGECTQVEIDGDGHIAQWDSYEQGNRDNMYKPRIGLLGQVLQENFDSDAILALGSGAGLALADSKGVVVGRYVDTVRVGDDALNEGRVSLQEGLGHIDDTAQLLLVDLGQVSYGESDEAGASQNNLESFKATFAVEDTALPEEAKADLSAIDDGFGQVIESIHARMPHARILVASIADSQSSRPELAFFAAQGLSDKESSAFAASASTRHEGIVQTVDLTATLVSWLAPNSTQSQYLAGSPIVAGKSTDSLADSLVSDHNRARLNRAVVGPVYALFIGLTVLIALVAWRVLSRRSQEEFRVSKPRAYLSFTALAVASIPVSSLLVNLVPCWNFPYPRLAFLGVLLLIALFIALVASVLAWRGKPALSLAIVGLVTTGVLMVDIVLDSFISSSLQFPSVLGTQPQVGGRFYGLSNATFAIFATGLLVGLAVFVAVLVRKGKNTQAGMLIVVGAVLALSVDGLAMFGADFGGPPALTLGLVLLFLIASGKKVTLPRALIACVVAVSVSIFFAILDYAQPAAQRSHLGRFIQSVIDGNLWPVLSRKLAAATFGIPLPLVALFALIVVIALVWLWKRWEKRGIAWRKILARFVPASVADVLLNEGENRQSENATEDRGAYGDFDALASIRYSFPAVAVTLISATFINDSSITIPLVGGAMMLMLYISVFLRTR